jgi:hypothetical protein
MFTFSSAPTMFEEKFALPGISVTALLPPLNESVSLDLTLAPADLMDWPNFHVCDFLLFLFYIHYFQKDGVAAGLRISTDSDFVTSSWINQNRPDEASSNSAGFIFALGLLGHLSKLQAWQVVDFFTSSHDITTAATALGIAASYIGQADRWVTRILSVHIPSLVQSDSQSMSFSPLAHTA